MYKKFKGISPENIIPPYGTHINSDLYMNEFP